MPKYIPCYSLNATYRQWRVSDRWISLFAVGAPWLMNLGISRREIGAMLRDIWAEDHA